MIVTDRIKHGLGIGGAALVTLLLWAATQYLTVRAALATVDKELAVQRERLDSHIGNIERHESDAQKRSRITDMIVKSPDMVEIKMRLQSIEKTTQEIKESLRENRP